MKILRNLAVVVIAVILVITSLVFLLPLKGSIPILMYHYVVPKLQSSLDVSVEKFEKQMRLIQLLGFKPISLDEFFAIKTGKKAPRGREIVITFDDGNETYVMYALPILERLWFPSANFLILESVTHQLNGSMGAQTVRETSKNPLVTFGSHTLTHEVLPMLELDLAREEMVESKLKLEDLVGYEIKYFSYPTGRLSEEIVDLAEDAGYSLAFTTAEKRALGMKGSRFAIPRIKVKEEDALAIFWYKISGIGSVVSKINRLIEQFHP